MITFTRSSKKSFNPMSYTGSKCSRGLKFDEDAAYAIGNSKNWTDFIPYGINDTQFIKIILNLSEIY